MQELASTFLSSSPNLTAADYQTWLTSTFGAKADEVAARYPLSDYPAPSYAQAQAFGDRLKTLLSETNAMLASGKAARAPIET